MLEVAKIKESLKLLNIKAFAEFADVHPNSLYRMRDSDESTGYSTKLVKKVSDALKSIGEINDGN